MFDDILQKANESMTQLSKTLTIFEKETINIRVKFGEELLNLENQFETKIATQKQEVEKIFSEYILKQGTLIEDSEKKLLKNIEESYIQKLADTGNQIENFFQESKKKFDTFFTVVEEDAKKRAEQAFDTDIESIFIKYGDRLIPIILKAFFRYIFRIKKG